MRETLEALGIEEINSGASTGTWLGTKGPELASTNPTDGSSIGRVRQATAEDYDAVVIRLYEASRTATRATLTFGRQLRDAVETNLLEEPLPEKLSTSGNQIRLAFRAFEIKTIVCKF